MNEPRFSKRAISGNSTAYVRRKPAKTTNTRPARNEAVSWSVDPAQKKPATGIQPPPIADNVAEKIGRIYTLVSAGKVDDAATLIFDWIDDAMLDSTPKVVDQIFENIDFSQAGTICILAIVSVTFPWKDDLPSRVNFFSRVSAWIQKIESPERAEKLLLGLK